MRVDWGCNRAFCRTNSRLEILNITVERCRAHHGLASEAALHGSDLENGKGARNRAPSILSSNAGPTFRSPAVFSSTFLQRMRRSWGAS
jgi:hypothetical protein